VRITGLAVATVTVALTVVGVVVAPRGEPVTMKLYGPGATVEATLIAKTLVVPAAVGVTGLELKLPQVIPAGRDELTQDNVTGIAVPAVNVAAIVTVPLLPARIVAGPLFASA